MFLLMKIYHLNQHNLNVFLISLKDDVFRAYLLIAKEKETFPWNLDSKVQLQILHSGEAVFNILE